MAVIYVDFNMAVIYVDFNYVKYLVGRTCKCGNPAPSNLSSSICMDDDRHSIVLEFLQSIGNIAQYPIQPGGTQNPAGWQVDPDNDPVITSISYFTYIIQAFIYPSMQIGHDSTHCIIRLPCEEFEGVGQVLVDALPCPLVLFLENAGVLSQKQGDNRKKRWFTDGSNLIK